MVAHEKEDKIKLYFYFENQDWSKSMITYDKGFLGKSQLSVSTEDMKDTCEYFSWILVILDCLERYLGIY